MSTENMTPYVEKVQAYAEALAKVTKVPPTFPDEPDYVPAIGDRVRIVDADHLGGDHPVGIVTDLNSAEFLGDDCRPHPIEVTADDVHSGWYAVEVELIETALEIAEYEEAMQIGSFHQRFICGVDPSEMTADDAQDLAEKWLYDRTPEQVAESDRAIEALRVNLAGTGRFTEEVRVTSATGGQKGSKVARFDLIPTGPLWELAEHYGKGAVKYERVNGKDNWRNGYDWSLSYAALQRHTNAFWSGEDIDPENGSKHIIAAAWHCLALAHFANDEALREQFDDRQDGV